MNQYSFIQIKRIIITMPLTQSIRMETKVDNKIIESSLNKEYKTAKKNQLSIS
jgi:hypothetical protein